MDATATVLFKKARRAVLALLFEQPQRCFYLRELERLSGISSGALRNEPDQLVGAGLVEKSRSGSIAGGRDHAASDVDLLVAAELVPHPPAGIESKTVLDGPQESGD